MNFAVRENSVNGTEVGRLPTGSSFRLLSGDKNNNGIPGLTVGADTIIRVSDASELDYERVNVEPNYYFLVSKDGDDDVIIVRVTDEINETLLGTPGDDRLNAGFGATLIIGLEGNDRLRAEFLDDILVGGPGADILTGGAGNDRFVLDASFRGAVDVITDFASGGRESDLIVLDRDIFGKLKQAKFRDKALPFEQVNGRRAAAQSEALIVYNARSGALFYNQNQSNGGFGAAGGKVAQLGTDLALSAASFLVQD